MTQKASTFRLDPAVRSALENLSSILKRPMNQLVNEALREFVAKRSREAEQNLEATLARLRACREHDPHFRKAIAAVVEAEAHHGRDDPAEGEVAFGRLVEGQLVEPRSAGEGEPVQSKIHRLLDAS